MSVYFIQSGEQGHIKIGQSSDPIQRIVNLQTGSPIKLNLLAIAENHDEFEIHKKFSHLRSRGEWFESDAELLEFVDKFPKPDPALWDKDYSCISMRLWESRTPMTNHEFKKTRKFLGLSQEQLGKVLGRERRQIIRYEKGNSDIPPWAELALESLVHRQEETT